MINPRKQVAVLIATLCLFVAACGTNSATESQQHFSIDENEHTQSHSNFMNLFKNASKIGRENGHENYIISDAVKQYLDNCCQDVNSAVRLLQYNGFNPTNTRTVCDPRKERSFNSDKQENHSSFSSNLQCREAGKLANAPNYRKQGYDDIFVGDRNACFLFVCRVYQVILYIKDDEVVKVTAKSFQESL